jgi:hypothetical protein
MGGGGGSPPVYQPPQAPDPAKTSAAQTQSNVQTAIANATLGATNQVTPYGSLTYTKTGGEQVGDNFVPSYTATQTLSPQQQAIMDQQQALQRQALGLAPTVLENVNRSIAQPLNFDGLPAMAGDQAKFRDEAYNALTARSTDSINRAVGLKETALRNQGVAEGSVAWNRAMQPFEQSRVDASQQGTINAGNLAGQNITQAQAVRNQAINEMLTQRNQPLQDYSTLMGFTGGVQNPQFVNPMQGTVSPTDVAGNINAVYAGELQNAQARYQGQLQAAQQASASGNAAMGGMMGLAGAGIGAAGFII